LIFWKDSLDFHPVRHPDRAALWQRLLSYREAESRPCGEINVTTYHLPPPGSLPAPGKIVFLSDLHYQNTPVWRKRLDSIEAALEELRPELLLLGGDVIGDAVDLPDLPPLLRRLKAHAKTAFAIAGNWEQGKFWLSQKYWRDLYRDCGICWLDNQSIGCGAYTVAGVEDLRGAPKLPAPPLPGAYNILLSHRADTAIHLDNCNALLDYGLILCGHNHGGQIRLPLWGSILGHGYYGQKFNYGLYQRRGAGGSGGPYMIVTSGLGELSVPCRFLCRREIVVVEHDG